MSKSIPELYGSLVFNDSEVMKSTSAAKDVYKALRKDHRTTAAIWNCDIANCSRSCHEGMGVWSMAQPTSPTGSSR